MAKDKFEKYLVDSESVIECYSFASIKLLAKKVLREKKVRLSDQLDLYSRRSTRQTW